MNYDKASSEYWSQIWKDASLPGAINPKASNTANYFNRMMHLCFQRTFEPLDPQRSKLLEIGAARSEWLPYFAKEFGFAVTGLDYSEVGCQQADQILRKENVDGKCVCADFNAPPLELISAFDVVVSFGVLEHFANTAETVKTFAHFLKPNGLLITFIPNMVGLVGLVQKIVNRPVYNIHVPLSASALKEANRASGLEILECRYFLFTNFGVPNLANVKQHTPSWWIRAIFLAGLRKLSLVSWFVEEHIRPFKANRVTSPYIVCIARKSEFIPSQDRTSYA